MGEDTPLAVVTMTVNADSTVSLDVKGELGVQHLAHILQAVVVSIMTEPDSITVIPNEVGEECQDCGRYHG